MNHRILHVIHSVKTSGGGPIEFVLQAAAAHRRQGYETEVVTLDRPEDDAVRGFPLRCHALGPAWTGYGYAAELVPWLGANHERFDAVVVNGIWQYHLFGTWRALRRSATPYFVFPHGMLDPWFKRTYPLKHVKKLLYWPWGDFRTLRDARAVIFTCEEERRLARQSFWPYRCRETVVNIGTTEPAGSPAGQLRAFLDRFPALEGKRCLLFLGRIHPKKGPDLVIAAFAEIIKKLAEPARRDLRLVMAGPRDSEYGREMERLALGAGLDGHVTWTGMLTGDAKWGAFRAAEAFILPSHQENFGIAVAEALACGVPVLISDQVNIWREIQEDGAGLVEPDDLAGTIRLIAAWLAADPQAWREAKQRARDCFARRFNLDRSGDALLRALGLNAKSNNELSSRTSL